MPENKKFKSHNESSPIGELPVDDFFNSYAEALAKSQGASPVLLAAPRNPLRAFL